MRPAGPPPMMAKWRMRTKVAAVTGYLSPMIRNVLEGLLLGVAVLATTACGSDNGPEDDVTAIRACYDNYFAALKEGRGDDAAALVDSRTVAHYERVLDLARHADSSTVAGLDIMDQIAVLAMRMDNDHQQLMAMDATEAIARSVSEGLMADEGPQGMTLGNVEVNGDEAQAPLKMYGFPTPAKFTFRREQDGWRIDITSLFELSRQGLEQVAKTAEGGNFVLQMLEESTGKKIPERIWHPGGGRQ